MILTNDITTKKRSKKIQVEIVNSKDNNGLVITDKSEETEEAISTDRSSLGVTNINLRLDGKNKSFLKTIENGWKKLREYWKSSTTSELDNSIRAYKFKNFIKQLPTYELLLNERMWQ
ncbi:unnamed protein product [Rhizophagus irregularis]|nr:unnamed protein product [Rhizophagus irregularis]